MLTECLRAFFRVAASDDQIEWEWGRDADTAQCINDEPHLQLPIQAPRRTASGTRANGQRERARGERPVGSEGEGVGQDPGRGISGEEDVG